REGVHPRRHPPHRVPGRAHPQRGRRPALPLGGGRPPPHLPLHARRRDGDRRRAQGQHRPLDQPLVRPQLRVHHRGRPHLHRRHPGHRARRGDHVRLPPRHGREAHGEGEGALPVQLRRAELPRPPPRQEALSWLTGSAAPSRWPREVIRVEPWGPPGVLSVPTCPSPLSGRSPCAPPLPPSSPHSSSRSPAPPAPPATARWPTPPARRRPPTALAPTPPTASRSK